MVHDSWFPLLRFDFVHIALLAVPSKNVVLTYRLCSSYIALIHIVAGRKGGQIKPAKLEIMILMTRQNDVYQTTSLGPAHLESIVIVSGCRL